MSPFLPDIYAIDFGTSNSLLVGASAGGVSPPVPLDPSAREPSVFRSILYFSERSEWFFGAEALSEYVAQGMRGRFLRSVKRFLPVKGFVDTRIGTRRVRLDEIVGMFLRQMRLRADRHFGTEVRRVLLGRPALFSEDPEADALAESRLGDAARIAGFDEVHFCPEPVAAAYDLGRPSEPGTVRGEGNPITVLVADLGGGTSDFTVARVGGDSVKVLSMGGVSVAGDVLDGTIMRHKIARHFGSEVTYQVPFGANVLTMPRSLSANLCSPAELCLLARCDVVRFLTDVRSWSLGEEDRRLMDQLLCLIEDALGFRVFEAIEMTKCDLSTAERAEFVFEYPDIEVREPLARVEFERYIGPHVERVVQCMTRTLAKSGLRSEDVELVSCTGGTARVPLIAEHIASIFGRERVRHLSSFHSVVRGLGERASEISRRREQPGA